MRNIKINVQYDGTGYQGWQRQARGVTVQEVLETAAESILREKIRVIGSGRTDAGVHAMSQAANFKTTSHLPIMNILRGMNSVLPFDIAVRDIEEVAADFHARYNAKSKRYRYCIFNGIIRAPLFHNYAWHVFKPLNVDGMNHAAAFLEGCHDFSTFRSSGSDVISTVRTVLKTSVQRTGNDLVIFDIEADGFLRYMVRSIVGTLVGVGTGKITPEEFCSLVESRNRNQAGVTAPPQGLYLMEVRYI